MFERFNPKSPLIAVVRSASEEARWRGDRRVGTEHLLLGLLHDPTSLPAQALGVDLDAARAALDALDRAALASIGVDVEGLRPASFVPSRRRAPWTSGAATALSYAVRATRARTMHLAPNHLLLTLLARERPDPAGELIAELGIDRVEARGRLELGQ